METSQPPLGKIGLAGSPTVSANIGSLPPPAYMPAQSGALPAGISSLTFNAAGEPKPTVDQCIFHLKLLEAFHRLRQDVGHTDGLFGIHDRLAQSLSSQTPEQHDVALAQVREKRWAVYVARAVDRFESWWSSSRISQGRPDQRFTQSHLAYEAGFDDTPRSGAPRNVTPEDLPPLDVLMVWHSYMLNPRDFFEDCIRLGRLDFWATGMPWRPVNSCIDNASCRYEAPAGARLRFEAATGRAWENLHDLAKKILRCPACLANVAVPWTTCGAGIDSLLTSQAVGYADSLFFQLCSRCGRVMNHDALRVHKFRRDLQLLLLEDLPMPGTILSLTGLPESAAKGDGLSRHPVTFPNRLLKAGLKTRILEITDPHARTLASMSDIKDAIQHAVLPESSLIREANVISASLVRPEKIAIRRMMSRYWENSSPFALDLVGAVVRQGSFVQKMHSIDWVHSPAVTSTMRRLVEKYERFFQIMAANPGRMVVPTLDVDLAWHTHQLAPPSYYAYATTRTQIFIDHDDKIDEGKLGDAFIWTSKKYQKMFLEAYAECACWYCASTRELQRSLMSQITGSISGIETRLEASDPPREVGKGAHVSAHSAVDLARDPVVARAAAAKLDAAYRKACERARKKGRPIPKRSRSADAVAYGSWGYPVPAGYAPHKGDRCTGGFYAGHPACMSVVEGAAGNCAAGTCGGTVAAGGCAGTAMG
ncbi:MAG: hypothetical protein M1832_006405, partial [Thelocarpon impressellum]